MRRKDNGECGKGYDYFKEAYTILETTGTAGQCIMKAGMTYEQIKKVNGEVLDKMIFMPVIDFPDMSMLNLSGNFIFVYIAKYDTGRCNRYYIM